MFAYVMQRPDLCIELLEYLFPVRKIQRVVYLTADEGSEADISIIVKDGIAKTYPTTQKTLAVAFDKGLYRYTFSNKCDEVNGMELGDESYKLFFSTVGTKEQLDEAEKSSNMDKNHSMESVNSNQGQENTISPGLKELLKYMNNTRDYPVESTQYDFIRRIDAAVCEAKQDKEWRLAYMTYQANQRDAELRGEARGEARGANTIITLMQKLFEAGRAADAEKASKDEAFRLELLKEFGLA